MPQTAFQYGGQAVIEGVMMRGPGALAVAVRRQGGEVIVEKEKLLPLAKRYPVLALPLVRGVVALLESLVIGVKALAFSASQAGGEGEEEALSNREIALSMGGALLLAVVLFVLIPTALAQFLSRYLNPAWQNLAEGLVRVAIFLAYVVAISRLKDIQRVFQYHGAEHKVIHAYEAGEELTVESARKYTTLHPRCGTAFLLIVMVLAVLVFSLLGSPGLLWRIGSRFLLFPVIAGMGYEFLKLSSRHAASPVMRALIAPGLWLQLLTTREPDDTQLEVAICALQAVLPEEAL